MANSIDFKYKIFFSSILEYILYRIFNSLFYHFLILGYFWIDNLTEINKSLFKAQKIMMLEQILNEIISLDRHYANQINSN